MPSFHFTCAIAVEDTSALPFAYAERPQAQGIARPNCAGRSNHAAIRADAKMKHPNGMSMREINREIAAYRREKRAKKP
jgi:hypothetical protein